MTIADKINKDYRSVDLERKILAYLLQKDPSQAIDLGYDYFTSESNKKLFDLVRKISTPMDEESVMLEFDIHREDSDEVVKEVVKKIFTVDISNISPRTFKLQSKELYDLFVLREVMNNCLNVIANGAKRNLTVDHATDVVRMMFQAATTPFQEKDRSADFLENYDARKEKVLEDMEKLKLLKQQGLLGSLGVPTGLEQFDTLTGGLMPTEFGVIAGRSNIGKTAALISFAVHAWRSGKSVLFISGEMNRNDIMHRIDSAVSVVPAILFRTKEFEQEHLEQWDTSIQELKKVQEAFFEVSSFDSSHFDAAVIEAEMDKVEDKHGKRVDLLCIDYINIMSAVGQGTEGGTKGWKEQSKAVWDLKILCSSRDTACWTAGQVTDDAINAKRLNLGHLKYSRAISEAAPVVVGLVRDKHSELNESMTLQMLKMRNTPCREEDDIELHPNFDVSVLHEEQEMVEDDL